MARIGLTMKSTGARVMLNSDNAMVVEENGFAKVTANGFSFIAEESFDAIKSIFAKAEATDGKGLTSKASF